MARISKASAEDRRILAAIESGDLESGADARAASYDPESGRLVIDLKTGARVTIPIDRIRSLQGASSRDLASLEVLGGGDTLNWEAMNVSLSTSKIVREVVGHAEQQRRAGAVSTPKKAAAGRANGKLGGRPQKSVNSKSAP